jgi:hypothetical protein
MRPPTSLLAAPGRRRLRPGFAMACVAGLIVVATSPLFAQSPPAFECRATQISGVAEADAATTVSLLCQELARVSREQGRFGVSIRPLGKAYVVTVRREPQGETRTLTLEGLEETPLAATRLAEALLLGRPIESTQRVDNLLATETRQPLEKKGSRKFTLGVTGLGLSGHDVGTGAGFSFGLAHESPLWAVLGELQYVETSGYKDRASLFAIGAGARRYLSRRDVAPYLGAGLERLSVSVSHDDDSGYRSLDGLSLAPYLELGVQAMRLSRARVTVGLRLHVPTSALEGETYEWSCAGASYYACDAPPEMRQIRERVVPLTFGLTVSF